MIQDCSFDKFKYVLYRPENANGAVPLIVILHGSGERGSSLSKLKEREPYISLSKGKCAPTACVLMPQLPKNSWGDYKQSLKKLIDYVAAENQCDTGCIAISGHSLGANGAMDMLFAYPDYFCAASILSPCKDYGDKLKELEHIPIWFLHGEKENSFKKYAQSMYNRFEKLGGTTRITSVTGYGHPIQFTWVSDKYQMFDWLTSFGDESPSEEVKGMICDVAKYQGLIDWSKLAQKLDFVIIKASGKEKDPYCDRNIAAAKQYGVPWHAYHYLYCTTVGRAVQEAKLFSDSVGDNNTPLFWVLDCEAGSGIKAADARTICEAFEAELRRLRGDNIRVAVYIAHELYKSWALDYGRYAYVWIPRYGSNDGTVAGSTKPDHPCDMWQFTSHGKAPGISDKVDLNKLMGTKPMSFFISGADTAPETPTAPDGDKDKDGGETQVFTGKQLAEYCEEMYKNRDHWAYWYGTYGNRCTQSKYNSKKKQYPDHYGSSRTSGYMKDIEKGRRCADCVGMIKTFFWTNGVYDAEPKYGTNKCPDKSANGMIGICKKTGPIKSIPDIPGLVVWKSGHIGVYVGGGYTVEMRGFDYDCVRRKVKDGPWEKWGMLPETMITYDESPEPAPTPEPTKLGDRDLKKGCEGDDVKELQNDLLKLGYSLPKYGADGDFGGETQKAVKAFQEKSGLTVDGVMNVGSDFDTLFRALDGDPLKYKNVIVTGGSVNVRTAPGYDTKILGVAHKGDLLPYQGEDKTAEGVVWHLVMYKNQNAWISGKYSKFEA